jgi:hypothetical protein
MRNESEENVLSNYVEGLAASGTEAEHREVMSSAVWREIRVRSGRDDNFSWAPASLTKR